MLPIDFTKGSFQIRILGEPRLITVTIHGNYSVVASFKVGSKNYKFKISTWIAEDRNGPRPLTKLHSFAALFFNKFGNTPYEGLSYEGVTKEVDRQIRMMIEYSVYDVFLCLKQISEKFTKCALNYALHHRRAYAELNDPLPSSYVESIHFVTCHCVVHSMFLPPDVQYGEIPFQEFEREHTFEKKNIEGWRIQSKK